MPNRAFHIILGPSYTGMPIKRNSTSWSYGLSPTITWTLPDNSGVSCCTTFAAITSCHLKLQLYFIIALYQCQFILTTTRAVPSQLLWMSLIIWLYWVHSPPSFPQQLYLRNDCLTNLLFTSPLLMYLYLCVFSAFKCKWFIVLSYHFHSLFLSLAINTQYYL